MTPAPNYALRRVPGLIVVAGLVSPLPGYYLGALDATLWAFLASAVLAATAILLMPLERLRRPTPAARTFRPNLWRLVFDRANPVGVTAFWFEVVFLLGLLWLLTAMLDGRFLAPGQSGMDQRALVGLFVLVLSVLTWPIIDWFAGCVHVTTTDLHVRLHTTGTVVPIGTLDSIRAGRTLRLRRLDGTHVPLPGTRFDAPRLVKIIHDATGRRLRVETTPHRKEEPQD